MSLRLNTGVMQYRESQNDVWKPMVIKTNLDWESLAEDYDATSAYEVGTYVLYNAELYRCTTAVPTGGEAWNAAHWIKVDFGSELNSLTEDVSELQEIAGNGALSGFTATDLTGAANELKNTLNQLAVQSPVVTSSNFSNPITCTGLTANHVVCNWGLFSDSACTTPLDPNNPPADITIEEGAGQYNLTIQNSSGTFYLKPIFILP